MEGDRSVAVLGAGAVGGYLGARLGQAHSSLGVTLIGRSAMAEAVRSRGLIVHEQGGEIATHPAVTTSVDGVPPADLVLLTVRTYDVEHAIPDLLKLMKGESLLLAFQNGVGTEETLARAAGKDRVLAATLTASEGMESPGVVTRYSRGGGVALASMNDSPVEQWVVDLFAATGLPTILVDDYRSLRWSKLLLNMLGAATTAILDMDIGAVMAHPELFRIEQRAFREAGRIMDAEDVRAVNLPGYPVPLARRLMRLSRPLAQRFLGNKIARARSGRSPGMRTDMYRGKTEIESFNGAVAREGRRLGISTPMNSTLTDLVLRLASDPDERSRFRGNPEALLAYIRTAGHPSG